VLTDGDHDVFGDGAITVLALPGHTPGNTGVLVRLARQAIILTMDTVHVRAAYEAEAALVHDTDQEQARASIRRMKQIAAAESAEVWIGHDPQDWAAYGAPVCVS
jgi:N-acyl homoserine lactone hydrolase